MAYIPVNHSYVLELLFFILANRVESLAESALSILLIKNSEATNNEIVMMIL